jgi:hypothetical protein
MGMLSGVVVVFCLGSKIGFGGSIMGGGGGSGCEVSLSGWCVTFGKDNNGL